MRTSFIFALTLFFCTFGYAQTAPDKGLQDVLQKLAKYEETHPQEKVYLHLDKPYYSVGDDIWFKAYITVGQLNFLSALSKILYVELISPDNRIVQSLRLPVLSGLSIGDFQLADSLREGNYRIRAYTNWMRNFDEDFFFDKTIPVGNILTDQLLTYTDFTYSNNPGEHKVQADVLVTDLNAEPVINREATYEVELDSRQVARGKARTDTEGKLQISFANKQVFNLKSGRIKLNVKLSNDRIIPKTIPIKHTGHKHTIQFFPESGNLLAGVVNKVGFKVLQPDGKGAAAHGYISDNSGQRLADFRTDYAGMGNLVLIPEAEKTYTAHVTFADSSTTEVTLPPVLASGYVLAVNNAVEKAIYLQAATTPAQATGQTLSLIAQKNGQVFYAVKVRQEKPETGMSIDRSRLPSGVIQLTLMDEQMKPLAERLIFNLNRNDSLPVVLSADKKSYKPLEKVTAKLSAGTTGDSVRIGSFSVVVTDLGKVPVNDSIEDGILSSLLLSAELKGYIETPGYYFHGINERKIQQLDNLMLTQGWRRIAWNDLLSGNTPAIEHKPEQAMRISGTVVRGNGKPVPKARVTVLSTTAAGVVIDTVADNEGRFNFDRLIFYDSTKFVVQARDEKGRKNVEVLMDEVPRQVVGKNKNAPDVSVDVNQSMNDYLKSREQQFAELQKYGLLERGILLDEVTVTTKKEEPVVKHSNNLNGPGNADQVLTAKDLETCPTLEMCLQGRLMGVIFRGGVPYSTRSQNTPMQIVLDGMYMEEDALSMIPPADIETIEVLRTIGNTAIYGSMGGGGVLVITTKRGDGNYSRDLYVPGIVTYSPQGYYTVREFYSPDYSQPQEHQDMQDLRSTILWKPDIVTDKNGEAPFEFYTASDPGRYRILVEGIDASGRIARAVSYIEVK